MLIFPMMLYLSTIMTGRCYIQPAADVVPAPGIDYSCTAPILPDPPSPPTTIGVKRPPSLRRLQADPVVARRTNAPSQSHCRFSSSQRSFSSISRRHVILIVL